MSDRHFLDLADFTGPQLRALLDGARRMKAARADLAGKGPGPDRPLDGRVLAMIFQQPSTRTRVSFDVGMRQLGGETIILSGSEMQLGRGETIEDTARVLSRYVDAIMIRILDHADLKALADAATVPVINGLTQASHPCQIMTDIMTVEEHRGPVEGKTIAWVGPHNNMLASFLEGAPRLGYRMTIGAPEPLSPDAALVAKAKAEGADVLLTDDPVEAVDAADVIVTDTWVSMGEDDGARHNMLAPYQVNAELMAKAKGDALFLHCLPAHRGEEVTDAVIDGPQSVVFDEAENRLHAQKAILRWAMTGEAG
ncbi:MAG: ornithine carbamoyltransferase [Pseudomonadota bacterium]